MGGRTGACAAWLLLVAGCGGNAATPSDGGGDAAAVGAPAYVSVELGTGGACALRLGGAAVCVSTGLTAPPPGPFTELGVGDSFACGLAADRTIVCWGTFWKPEAHPGTFLHMAVGENFVCGLRAGGAVECWGDTKYRVNEVPMRAFEALGAGAYHACGIDTAGALACWGGVNAFGAPVPPLVAPAVQLGGGSKFSCALSTDGAISCTGLDPPPGTFMSLGTGISHACAIRADGMLACWGTDQDGEATAPPPAGVFAKVGAGAYGTCAVRVDGRILCWGQRGDQFTKDFAEIP
jgi:alpha-tubulin suppressor-like RCC1 family protein